MKPSEPKTWYLWALAAAVLPNLALSFTETLPWWGRIINIILPLGCWGLVLTASRRLGLTILCLLPLFIINAWEIVLLALYGRSVIAVDMFLNLLTTNASEVGELLGNLWVTMLLIIACYVPPLVGAIRMLIKHSSLPSQFRRIMAIASGTTAAIGAIALAISALLSPALHPFHDIYPLNGFDNLRRAIIHSRKLARYPLTSANFSFNATPAPNAPDSCIIVLVIGETSRSDRWQLNGYQRPTTPLLSARKNAGEALTSFSRTLSESNTTHKSVPLLLSHLNAASYGDSIYHVKSLITAFKEAGFSSAFLSNQRYNGSFIDHFAFEADTTLFVKEQLDPTREDTHLNEIYSTAFLAPNSPKHLLVIHTYGSHFSYRDRYSTPFFTPDQYPSASANYRPQLNNAYDNTIRATDQVLDNIIAALAKDPRPAVLLYVADHGEDIFDDSRHLFLHASPFPSFFQVEVPLIIWLSPAYNAAHPLTLPAISANSRKRVSSSESVFHTLLQLADIVSPRHQPDLSVASPTYRQPSSPQYLNDHNEALPLTKAGFQSQDIKLLQEY